MAVRSMTGFGRGNGQAAGRVFQAEARSVNHKFLDVKIRVPVGLSGLEGRLQALVRRRLARGRLDVFVSLAEGSAPVAEPRIDLALARAYAEAFSGLGNTLGLSGQLAIGDLVRLHETLCVTEVSVDLESLAPALEAALDAALSDVEKMRTHEGQLLQTELLERLAALERHVSAANAEVPAAQRELKERLDKRISELLGGTPVDPMRLAQEVAFLIERSDVTEELARLRAHLSHFRALMRSGEPAGRKLDFLCQELHRETNTLGSKTHHAALSTLVVEMKAEIERIREQVQNVE